MSAERLAAFMLTIDFELRGDLLPRPILVVHLLEARVSGVKDLWILLYPLDEEFGVENHHGARIFQALCRPAGVG